jgi:hypothetical protein
MLAQEQACTSQITAEGPDIHRDATKRTSKLEASATLSEQYIVRLGGFIGDFSVFLILDTGHFR